MNAKKQSRVDNKKRKAEALERLVQLKENDKKKAKDNVIIAVINDQYIDDKQKATVKNIATSMLLDCKMKKDLNISKKGQCKTIINNAGQGKTIINNADQSKTIINNAGQSKTIINNGKTIIENAGELEQLRARLREEQKLLMSRPKLIPMFNKVSELAKGESHYRFNKDSSILPPLFMFDIQHLLLPIIQGQLASYKPRWGRIVRWGKVSKVVNIILDDVSLEDIHNYSHNFKYLTTNFNISMELVPPAEYGSDVLQDLFLVPISNNIMSKNGFGQAAGCINEYRNLPGFSTTEDYFKKGNRVDYLLNPQQMVKEDYPLPQFSNCTDYVFTHEEYSPVTAESPIYGIDCEMCQTTVHRNELVWIAVVDENLNCIYNSLVKPPNPVIDYMTRYSGVTKEVLDPVFVDLKEVQAKIKEIIPNNAIICGHSLNGDLHAMQMFHPYVIDTSCIYNINGCRTKKSSLALLAKIFLQKHIQMNEKGHDPAEDARAAMELVQEKLNNGIYFGDVLTGGSLYRKQLEQILPVISCIKSCDIAPSEKLDSGMRNKSYYGIPDSKFKDSLFSLANKFGRRAAVIDTKHNEVIEALDAAEFMIVENDKEAIKKLNDNISSVFLTCITLRGDGGLQADSSEKEKSLKKLDKSIKRITSSLPEKCIVNVILSGRITYHNYGNLCHNAANFFKIT